jgi:hypothetical protein
LLMSLEMGMRMATKAHNNDTQAKEQKQFKNLLQKVKKAINTLNKFHGEAKKNWSTESWSTESQHIMGHVAHSPPIFVGTGPKHFTEDWALIELYDEKINWKDFKGNVIDLLGLSHSGDLVYLLYPGTKIPVVNFTKMYSHLMACSFKYLHAYLL